MNKKAFVQQSYKNNNNRKEWNEYETQNIFMYEMPSLLYLFQATENYFWCRRKNFNIAKSF